MKLINVTILTIFFHLSAMGQVATGKINFMGNKNNVYQVSIAPNDTVYHKVSCSFYTKTFFLPMIGKGKAIMEISAAGYDNFKKEINFESDTINIGTISLIRNIELKEVFITHPRIKTESDGADFTIKNISNTYMGNAGSLMDMLRWTPGVMVSGNNGITVIGEGAPIIYINDREIKNNSELYALRSTDVTKVEVIRDTGARYGASVNSVIRIYTRRPIKDYLGASVLNATEIKRKMGNTTGVIIDGKRGIVSGNFAFTYMHGNSRINSTEYTQIEHTSQDVFTKSASTETDGRTNLYNIFGGLNFALSKKSVLGMQYNGTFNQLNFGMKRMQQLTENAQTTDRLIYSDIKNKINMHNVSTNFTWDRTKNSKLTIIADYATNRHTDDNGVTEKVISLNTASFTPINTNNDYDIYTVSSEYSFSFKKKDSNVIGTDYGHVSNDGITLTSSIPQYSNRNNDWFAMFYTFKHSWKKFALNLGLRYEYDRTHTIEIGKMIEPSNITKTYSDLFPNGRLMYTLNKNAKIGIIYSRKIIRPSYNDLKPTIFYLDSLTYSTGNPLLKPTFINRLELVSNLYGMTIRLGYSDIKNGVYNVYINNNSTNVTYCKPINIDYGHKWTLSVDYLYNNNWLNIGLHGDMTLPYYKYPYLDRTIIANKVDGSLYANLGFRVFQKYMLSILGLYNTPYYLGTTHGGSTVTLNIGAATFLCKNKLYVSVEGMDLFRRSITPWTRDNYLNTSVYTNTVNDTRGVKITLRYLFNMIENPFKKRSGNEDVINRTN